MIKVNSPYIGDEEIQEVGEVLKSGIIAHGPLVEEFEKEFARYLNVPYVVTVSNGTVALYAALKALGIGPGDEVIVPDFTFFATASSVVLAGGRPVFADIELDTYTISPDDVFRKVSPKTKAIIVVHLYGHPVDIDPILKLAYEKGLHVIEDCAQSHGARYKGKVTGSIGSAGTFSFYATKNLTMGEGGAVSTSSEFVRDFIRRLRNHGQTRRYWHEDIGWNFRITSIQAAIGLVQLRKLDEMNNRRREIAKIYSDELSTLQSIRLPVEKPWAKHVYHQYTIWVNEEGIRDRLANYLRSKEIQTGIHYPNPLHKQPALMKYSAGDCCPNAEIASKHVISLPMHPGLSDEDALYVAETVKKFFKDVRS